MNRETVILASDNHGERDAIHDLQQEYPLADHFFHCGDTGLPVSAMRGWAAVRGRSDSYAFPDELIVEIGSHRILLIHGFQCLGNDNDDFLSLAHYGKGKKCDIVCFGHTHIPMDQVYEGVRLINPGSLLSNRDGSGKTYMILTFEGDHVSTQLKHFVKKH